LQNLLEIPWQDLPEDTFYRLVEEFVTRDGTDYGEHEVSSETKVNQVIQGIKCKEYIIVFNQEEGSAHICPGPFRG